MKIIWTLLMMLSLTINATAEPWKRHTIDRSSKGADGVRLMDVNGDGLLDVATGWEEGGVVRAYLNPGLKKSKAEWPAVTVGRVKSAEDAVFFDVDDDGAIDVVSCCEGKTKTVFVHWAPKDKTNYLDESAWKTEPFPVTASKASWMFAMPMQIDGKGGVDLVVASKGKVGSGVVGWLEAPKNLRNSKAWKFHHLAQASWIMSLRKTDMDGDGDLDVLASDRKGENSRVFWLENPNAGDKWKEHVIGAVGEQVMFLDIADLNGNGRREIVVPIPKRDVMILSPPKDPREKWQERRISFPTKYGTSKAARIVDVDGDGKMDIVGTCEHADKELSGVFWLSHSPSSPDNQWTDHDIGGPLGIKYDRIEMIDVDGDGDLDLMSCEERDQLGVFWYENPTK
ncbi:MAG: VCBS repeat-containing protein [Planctomycetaceae bacterium]|nr:VCBS repeat-containing protein [Planctomycetaceae bacterium]